MVSSIGTLNSMQQQEAICPVFLKDVQDVLASHDQEHCEDERKSKQADLTCLASPKSQKHLQNIGINQDINVQPALTFQLRHQDHVTPSTTDSNRRQGNVSDSSRAVCPRCDEDQAQLDLVKQIRADLAAIKNTHDEMRRQLSSACDVLDQMTMDLRTINAKLKC